MAEQTIELEIPAEIYERAEAIANSSDQSAESVLLDGLSLLFVTLPDLETAPEALPALLDEQLWALVHRRLTPKQDARLRDLLQLGNQGRIESKEERELARLADVVD